MKDKITRRINHRFTIITPDGIKSKNGGIKYSIDKKDFISIINKTTIKK